MQIPHYFSDDDRVADDEREAIYASDPRFCTGKETNIDDILKDSVHKLIKRTEEKLQNISREENLRTQPTRSNESLTI